MFEIYKWIGILTIRRFGIQIRPLDPDPIIFRDCQRTQFINTPHCKKKFSSRPVIIYWWLKREHMRTYKISLY